MPLRNSVYAWGALAQIFHWLMALLIIGLLIWGYNMSEGMEMAQAARRRGDPALGRMPWIPGEWTVRELGMMYQLHKSAGLVVLMLGVLRLVWRMVNPAPPMPAHMPAWQKGAARSSHFLLYVLLFLMPLSGWVMSSAGEHMINFFLTGWAFPFVPGVAGNERLGGLAHSGHFWLAWAITGLLVIHVGAALTHHFVKRDNVLRRMLPGASHIGDDGAVEPDWAWRAAEDRAPGESHIDPGAPFRPHSIGAEGPQDER